MAMDGAASMETWTPNFAHAPFRLLAVVYRPDLGIVRRDNAIANAKNAGREAVLLLVRRGARDPQFVAVRLNEK